MEPPIPVSYTHLDVYKRQVRATLFACATDESKPILTGALFEVKEESISVVALDGYRLAIYRDVPQNHRLPVSYTHLDVYKRQV